VTAYRSLGPAADLAPFVQHYWRLTGEGSTEGAHPIFPDGAPELVFNLGGPVRQRDEHGEGYSVQPRAVLVGQMTRTVWVVTTGRTEMVGIKFTPWGASAFFGGDSNAWRDRTVTLAELCADADVFGTMLECSGAHDDAWLAEQFDGILRDRLDDSNGRRLHRLSAVARALHQSSGGSVDVWAHELGWSARTLERHFGNYVGLSPKELLRLNRFQRALILATDQPRLSLSMVAARAGYADHSHLVREFRAFAGAPPGAVLSSTTAISSHFLSEPPCVTP
jgi:AraC-like DNA-binding protein